MRNSSNSIEESLRPTIEGMGYQIWGIEFTTYSNRAKLCVFIDSSKGITIDDCAQVHNQIEGELEVTAALPPNCTLQVSSPGLDRILFRPEQFTASLGAKIDVRLVWPQAGRSHLRGELCGCDHEQFRMLVEEQEFTIGFDQVKRARLVPSLD